MHIKHTSKLTRKLATVISVWEHDIENCSTPSSPSSGPPWRAARRHAGRAAPGTLGTPPQTPCTTLPAGESPGPARPSNQRLRARPRAPPVGRPTGRSTARRPPVAAAGLTLTPRPAPAVRLPHPSGFNATHPVPRPATRWLQESTTNHHFSRYGTPPSRSGDFFFSFP